MLSAERRAGRSPSPRPSPPGGGRGGEMLRQPDPEHRSSSFSLFHLDPRAVSLRRLLGDREAQTGAERMAAPRLVEAGETLEDTTAVSARDTRAAVRDLQRNAG